jgi:Winged helix-turn-helix DNA-binding
MRWYYSPFFLHQHYLHAFCVFVLAIPGKIRYDVESVQKMNIKGDRMPITLSNDVDKKYSLLYEIDAHSDISQRQLSHITGLSLGTVNLLLQPE